MLFAHDRVEVLAGVAAAGPYGGTVLDWSNPTIVAAGERANVQPAGVTEEVVNAQRIAARYEVRIRPDVTVDETNRVRWDDGAGDRDYEIVAVKRWPRGTPGLRHTHLIIQRVQEG